MVVVIAVRALIITRKLSYEAFQPELGLGM